MAKAPIARGLLATCFFPICVALQAETATFSIDPARSSLTARAEPVDPFQSITATATIPVEARFGEGDDVEVVFVGELVAAANFGQALGGDFNNNGLVEQADVDLVLLNWGQSSTPPPEGWVAELPSGVIDQDELDGVLLNWGSQAPPLAASESIPEPYTFLLLLLAPTPLFARLRW